MGCDFRMKSHLIRRGTWNLCFQRLRRLRIYYNGRHIVMNGSIVDCVVILLIQKMLLKEEKVIRNILLSKLCIILKGNARQLCNFRNYALILK